MEFISDNFISYNDEFIIKQEKQSEHEEPHDVSSTSESTLSLAIPQSLQNLVNLDDQALTIDPPCYAAPPQNRKRPQPFNIIKMKRERSCQSPEQCIEVKIEADDKLANRTKRIIKREKAKQRMKVKLESPSNISTVNSKLIPEGFNNPDLDDKTKKKMVQMIRNRISAQNSRDRKKQYMVQLEDVRAQLMGENTKLAQEKAYILSELKKMEEAQKKLKRENRELKKNAGKPCNKCNHNEEVETGIEEEFEEDSQSENLSSMLKTLTGTSFDKLSKNNKKFHKCTMALATVISILMVVNITQQGNTMMQDGTGKIKPNGIERKMLEIVGAVKDEQETNESNNSPSKWNLLQHVKPIVEYFGEKHKKTMETGKRIGVEEESTIQPTFIKLEEFDSEHDIKNQYLRKPLAKKVLPLLEDESLLYCNHEEEKITDLCHNPFSFGHNEEPMTAEDHIDADPRVLFDKNEYLKAFDVKQNYRRFTQDTGLGDEDQIDGEEAELGSQWCSVFKNNGFGYN